MNATILNHACPAVKRREPAHIYERRARLDRAALLAKIEREGFPPAPARHDYRGALAVAAAMCGHLSGRARIAAAVATARRAAR